MDHIYTFLTTQGHGGPPRMSDQPNAGATSETAQTWKAIHTKHTLSHPNKTKMEWWWRRPNDIRGPWGPKGSWHLSYRWGKTPKKPHPGNLTRPGIEPGPPAWQARMQPFAPQRWTSYAVRGEWDNSRVSYMVNCILIGNIILRKYCIIFIFLICISSVTIIDITQSKVLYVNISFVKISWRKLYIHRHTRILFYWTYSQDKITARKIRLITWYYGK